VAKGKLELTWVGKEDRPRLEPRVLVEDPAKSYGDPNTENMLIFGNNLLALKALEQEFTDEIKCIYIDPPFNTGEMFDHYDDGVEHSVWLTQMRDRLDILHQLLAKEGTLFVHIDDNELGYLIVLLDEIFGRNNRVYVVTFKQGSATGHKSINPGCVNTTNYVVIYAKNKASWTPNRLFTGRERDTRYGQFIRNVEDHHENWEITTLTKAFAANQELPEKEARKFLKEHPELMDQFVLDNAKSVMQLARPDYDGVSAAAKKLIDKSQSDPKHIYKLERQGYSAIYLVGGKRILFYADKLKLIDGKYVAGEPLTTLWDDILSNNLHAEGGVEFPKGKKPEALIKRVIELTSNNGDWVLDSFAGSGTTGAVAQKMGRRWIMVELGEHCHTHIVPRLKQVIDGADPGGITEAVAWKGGGGFRYYRLAESVLVRDKDLSTKDQPVWIINPKYDDKLLIRSICKIENFRYRHEGRLHGISSERRFLHVTTRLLTQEYLDSLAADIGQDQSLLVYCTRKMRQLRLPENVEIKRIPRDLLDKCDFQEDR
jgi:adenine-specific DNA-methyltransferase